MSADLYPIRVYFSGESGIVRCPGVNGVVGIVRKISLPPEIPGLPKLCAIDYAPAFFPGELQPWAGQRREMYKSEIEAVKTWLWFVQRDEA